MRLPPETLLCESFKAKYGSLYEDLKSTRAALWTTVFHNGRCFVLIALLVMLSEYPMAQAICYSLLSVAGLMWDTVANPYEGRMLTLQILTLDFAKLAAGVGYITLTLPGEMEAFAEWMCGYEIILFLVAIISGMALSLAQQVADVYAKIREWCQHRNDTKVVPTMSMTTDPTQNSVITRTEA